MHNFYAGPGKLPLSVLERVRSELTNFRETEMSIMEISHRAPPVTNLIASVEEKLRTVLQLSDEFAFALMQGGGSLQFLMVPMNLSMPGDAVDYVDTGYWAAKAIHACHELERNTAVVASSHSSIPSEIVNRENARYLHFCSNNTVVGTQFNKVPKATIPLVADMSSDFLTRVHDYNQYGLIYAHAQKNIGISGVTVVLVKKELLRHQVNIPEFLKYSTHINAKSNYHTPPVFQIYVLECMLDWLMHEIGGLKNMHQINQLKSDIVYQAIDRSVLFENNIDIDSRSMTNVVFDLADKRLSARFLDYAEANGFFGLAGHRSIGGFRASLYNPVTIKDCQALADLMDDFEKRVA